MNDEDGRPPVQAGRPSASGRSGGAKPKRPAPSAVSQSAASAAEPDQWLTWRWFALLLGGLIFAAFPQVLLGLETFVVRDYGFFAFPVAHFQQECFWKGQLPLWNPYNNCGLPFLAQWNTMPLYPPAVVYLLLPLSWSLSFFCLLHLFWGGLGMYFLAQRWTTNRLAAAAAGVIFAFNGLSLNLLMWPSHIATVSWMPWVVLCVERGWRQGGRWFIAGALAGAFQMLAGGPETILFTWLLLSAFWLLTLWQERGKRPFPILWRFPSTVLLVACLAAVQLLPFLDLATHSERSEGFADTRWSMPGWGWANFLVPMVFGSTWGQHLFFQYGQFWTSSYYLGLVTLLAAAFGFWHVRTRRFWLLGAISLVAILLAGGDSNPFSRWARRVVPQLTLMTYPVKFLLLLIFTAPLLAAFGLSRLRCGSEGSRTRKQVLILTAALLALIVAVVVWAWGWPFPQDNFPATLRNGLSRLLFAAIAGVLLLALSRPLPNRLQRLVPLLLLLVLWLDVWTHEPTQNPTVPPGIYQAGLARQYLQMNPQPGLGQSRAMVAPTAETKFLQRALEEPEKNFLAKRMGYFADCNLLDGVPKVNGFFSLYPRHTGELTSNLYLSTNTCPSSLADFLSVSQETAPGQYTEWRSRNTFMPWATAGQQPVFLDEPKTLALLCSPQFDTRRFVLLPPEARGLVEVTNHTEAQVTQQRFSTTATELEVTAKSPSLVVISQTYYHPWRAYVDGRPAPLLRANYAFQAVVVPAGNHSVRLAYQDHALWTGALVSGLALLACLGGWLLYRPAQRGEFHAE